MFFPGSIFEIIIGVAKGDLVLPPDFLENTPEAMDHEIAKELLDDGVYTENGAKGIQ